jgi:hypothetical protein
MPFFASKLRLLASGLSLGVCLSLKAQDSAAPADDTIVMMEAFNVSAYGGKIPIIDGLTGKDYRGNNQVVFDFATSFNKLLLGYHRKLVTDEIKHMQFRIKLGDAFEKEMSLLTASFGYEQFALDKSQWLRRERAIISRLIKEPFFKINSLIAWDIDKLNAEAPEKPKSKYAKDIHFNPDLKRWERRITDRWDVFYRNNPNYPNSSFTTDKTQGLNLDTLKGFHFIERGLPAGVPSHAFKEVKLTYPIFYSDQKVDEEALQYLQQSFVANLIFIYDPFSWMARRDTRFRGGFMSECMDHIQAQRIYVEDRKWFDSVFARFLSDVVTIKLQGVEEIYALHMLNKRINESPRALGQGLDLLNWNKGEKREAIDKPETEARIPAFGSGGFRYVMIDAYQRFGDSLFEQVRNRLAAQAETRQKIEGQAMLKQVIETLSDMKFNDFAQRAKHTHEQQLALHKLTS